MIAIADFLELRISKQIAVSFLTPDGHSVGVRVGQNYQLLGITHRQHSQQHRIDDRENGRVSTDAEREGENRDCGEPRVLREHPYPVLQVLNHRTHLSPQIDSFTHRAIE